MSVSSALEVASLLDRAVLGAFFTISGFHKSFNPARRATLAQTFRDDGRYSPALMVLIPGGELLGGIAILAGFLTPLAALGLFVICTGACALDGLKRVKAWQPLDAADAADDVLYLPETLYLVLLTILMLIGPGRFSLDAYLVRFL